jgi:hypothetical protein
MEDHHKMRASDGDRQEAVERLRASLEDGRLKMDEYLDRIGLAYEAVTYGDLAPLYADLPEVHPMAKREAAPPAAAAQAAAGPPGVAAAPPGVLADLPAALKVLWSINVVVWVLVSGTTGHLIYPWPVWVAGPSGAALFAVSAGVTQIRRSRRSAGRGLPAGKG